MRYALVLAAATLFAPPTLRAADPPITFQSHSLDRVLDELRAAADLVGGEKAVKAVNKSIKDTFGPKGLDGLDISRPVVGYVLLDPKPANITAVVALPITGEKEFLALCDRTNRENHKDLGKGLYQLPPLNPVYKARMRFSDGYAYIAYGANPEPALDAKAIVPAQKLYDPAEKGIVAAKLHFDRISLPVKLALPAYAAEVKRELELDQAPGWIKAMIPEMEKMFTRFALLLGGADTATVRLNIDVPTSDVVVEAVLTPKAGTALAKELTARKPTANQFAALVTPDTAVGFHTRLPFFNDELKAAMTKSLEELHREAGNVAGAIGKDLVDELFKGFIRTVKTGEADVAVALRGPNKDGDFTFVGAFAFDDTAALAKEFKKTVEAQIPGNEQERIKWDADKAGNVAIHTYQFPGGNGWLDPSKVLGGGKCLLAWAFAPKGVYVVIGPDAVADLKTALTAKPAEAPVLDIVLNPSRMVKFVEKIEPTASGNIEKALGKEDKLVSAASLRVSGGQNLTVRFALNLRMLPKALVVDELEREVKDVPDPVEKK